MISTTLVSSSCVREQVPADILPKTTMALLIRDIHGMQEQIATVYMPLDSLQALHTLLETRIYAKYGVSDSVYLHNLRYYASRPRHLEKIYEIALDSLGAESAR